MNKFDNREFPPHQEENWPCRRINPVHIEQLRELLVLADRGETGMLSGAEVRKRLRKKFMIGSSRLVEQELAY
jgi:hypothetical protein